MPKIFLYSFLLLSSFQCGQKKIKPITDAELIEPVPFSELPKSLSESSGLEVIDGKIYSMNDHGGNAEIIVLDQNGEKENKLKIKSVKAEDWESLAANSKEFFIGDFGNNSGNREDLTIYRFPLSELNQEDVKVKKIQFQYANQSSFKNKKRQHSFDGESLIALEDELVIFSKDWVENATQVYHIPLTLNEEKLSISPSEKMPIGALITGADYDEKNKRLVLCGYKDKYNFLWIFENSTSKEFLTPNFRKLELDGLYGAQIEGVTFLDDKTILFSTEKTHQFKPQIWTITLK